MRLVRPLVFAGMRATYLNNRLVGKWLCTTEFCVLQHVWTSMLVLSGVCPLYYLFGCHKKLDQQSFSSVADCPLWGSTRVLPFWMQRGSGPVKHRWAIAPQHIKRFRNAPSPSQVSAQQFSALTHVCSVEPKEKCSSVLTLWGHHLSNYCI